MTQPRIPKYWLNENKEDEIPSAEDMRKVTFNARLNGVLNVIEHMATEGYDYAMVGDLDFEVSRVLEEKGYRIYRNCTDSSIETKIIWGDRNEL